jgi:FkbM family methyltransferase
MITATPFTSYAQNGEDVILNRVLATVKVGSYIDVGSNHPRTDSVSRSFYERGWSGIEIDPNPSFAELFHEQRPRDVFLEAAITDAGEATVTFHLIEGTGLSTLDDSISQEHAEAGLIVTDITVPAMRLDAAIEAGHLQDRDIHFLLIDTEGAELSVLRSIDFTRYRPWILIVEATAPGNTIQRHQSWERIVLDADYEFCLFDGLSRFYVAKEKSAALKAGLVYPVCVFDDYVKDADRPLKEHIQALEAELADTRGRLAQVEGDIAAVRASRSWKITRPLRALSTLLRAPGAQ